MAILTISKKEFEKDIGKLNDEMQNKIALFGTPLEKINDKEIQIEIFPNRPDLLSYQNFKLSFLSYLGRRTNKKIKINKPEKNYEVNIESSVNKVRPYTVCAIVKNLKFNDERIKEIIDVQEKLHITLGRKRKKAAIGIYPLEKIKLPISYKALSPEKIKFQPLDFPSELNGRQILSQHPTGRDYGNLLKNVNKYPVFVDANNEILSMPPIINSHKTGKISLNTKDVFVECSGFDLNTLNRILNIIVLTLNGMKGEVYQMKLKYSSKKILTPDFSPEKMKISLENVNKLLGLKLAEKEIKRLLEKMGHEYKSNVVFTSSTRNDILHEVDLIEDIAIAYGYDNFIPEIPNIAGIGEVDSKERIKEKIAEILTGLGLLETSSYHLINKETIKKTSFNSKNFIKIKNSKTEYEFLRKDLSGYLLKILGENVDVEYPQELFQIGRIFNDYEEEDHLAIILTPGNFTRLKQIVGYLGRMLNIKFEITSPESIPKYFISGRTAQINLNDKAIGFFGEIHPKILKNFKLKMPASLLEIDLNEILN